VIDKVQSLLKLSKHFRFAVWIFPCFYITGASKESCPPSAALGQHLLTTPYSTTHPCSEALREVQGFG